MVSLEILIAERLGSLARGEGEVLYHEVDSAVRIPMRREPSAHIVKRVINIEMTVVIFSMALVPVVAPL